MSVPRYSVLPHTTALDRGELLVSACAACLTPQFPPKACCGTCGNTEAPSWLASTGTGHVWSFAAFHKQYLPEFFLATPYVVAVIELAEGVRLYGNVVGTPASDLRIGAPVCAQFDARSGRLIFTVSDEGAR